MKPTSSVAVTGIGAICAAGGSVDACCRSLFKPRRRPRPPRSMESGHATPYPVFEIPAEFFPSRQRYRQALFRTSRLAMSSAEQAMADAGLREDQLRSLRVGVCVGTTVGSTLNSEAFYRQWRLREDPPLTPVKRFLYSNPAACIANRNGFRGPCQTVVNACSSGLDAIGIGSDWIQSGVCDVVIAGGADELCRVTYNGFIALMISDADSCRPFDARRNGLNLGEGAAMVVLEAESVFSRRARKPRARILGYGNCCDAFHPTRPHPQGRGLRRAVEQALDTARLGPEDIHFVHAHGTGTKDNDKVESLVIHDCFPGVPFFSTKGHTGHALGAAGALATVFTIAMLESGYVPPSAGFRETDLNLAASPSKDAVSLQGRTALTQTLAFGGGNAALIVGREMS